MHPTYSAPVVRFEELPAYSASPQNGSLVGPGMPSFSCVMNRALRCFGERVSDSNRHHISLPLWPIGTRFSCFRGWQWTPRWSGQVRTLGPFQGLSLIRAVGARTDV